MQPLPPFSNARTSRSALAASVVALTGAVLANSGCRSGDGTLVDVGNGGTGTHPMLGSSGNAGRVGTGSGASSGASSLSNGGAPNGGSSPSAGTPGSGGTLTSSGGTGNTTAVAGTGGAAGGAVSPSSGGMSSGGVSSGGVSSGGVSSGGVSSGGIGTGGLAGGGGMGAGGKPCVDVQPPDDPKWPGATCEDWATQTSECGADWFASYCDVSCGRCVPEGGGGSTAVDCSTAGLPNVTGGDGFATRYWDCCQTHCGQSDGHRCAQDGVSKTSDTNSACNGGGSYACYDEAPHAVSDCLSYGYIAKANPNCGGCYRIQFTGEGKDNANDPGSKLIKGKQMIVKVSNTGGDVASNQFDVMVPGGGVGQFNACSKEWGTSDLGAQYGGFFTQCTGAYSAKKACARDACMKLPSGQMRDGCIWFTDWLQAADNPKFTSQTTNCPF